MQRQGSPARMKIGVVAALVVGLCGSAGCRKPKPGPPPRPAPRWSGVALVVQCPAGPIQRLFETHGQTWAHDVGAQLTIAGPQSSAAPSIVVLPPVDVPALAVANRARTLPDASETAAFLPLYRIRLLNWDTRAYALPLIGDGLVCVFREDVYADTALRAAYRTQHSADFTPPETWDDFAQQAAFFAEKRGRSSLPPLPADDAGLDRAFYGIAAPLAVRAASGSLRTRGPDDPSRAAIFSFQYDAVTGEPRIATPGFVAALALLQKLAPLRSVKPDAVAALRDGDAVFGVVTLAELAALRGSGVHWGVARVPGSRRVFADGPSPAASVNVVPYVGSTGALGVVPHDAPSADAAFDLLLYLCSETISQEVIHDPSFGSGPYRDANLNKQAMGWFNYGLDEPNTLRLRDYLREIADPRLDNPGLALRTPDQASHCAALLAAIRRCLREKSDPAAALGEVDREWRKLDGDPSKAKALYRKSLGL